ncbi:MAG: hypothetical protein U1F77_17030 [Kiritimatiellia bacterium]
MKSRPIFRPLALLVALAGLAAGTGRAAPDIRLAPGAGPRQRLAAAEIRRYVYLRTGELLEIRSDGTDGSAGTDARIYLKADPGLAVEAYRLKTEGPALTISGGTDLAVLYGAYAFVEKLGVRFLIDGDVLPDERMPFALPALDETHAPLFELRGLLPFHDFPEGPDWWTRDDWKAILGQAVKMRMNFVGLHTYPWHNRDLGPEPTVWVGLPEDVNEDGTVKVSDPTSWYSTAKFQPYGCYRPAKTGGFSFGADQVFPADDYGPEVNAPEDHPLPKTPAAGVALMNRTGAMLRDVFTEARSLGMKTCVGTESPLDIPDGVAARLKELGMDPKAPATLQKLYEGMFLRIQRAFPVDYYWIWGHEGEIDQARFVTNLQCARAALASIKAPFRLGICGWGWITGNFPALDKALDRDVVFSAISMSVGNAPVSPNLSGSGTGRNGPSPGSRTTGRSAPQFHVGRMRKDAVDARAYGCNGLMGLHWRTRVISPTSPRWRRPDGSRGRGAGRFPRTRRRARWWCWAVIPPVSSTIPSPARRTFPSTSRSATTSRATVSPCPTAPAASPCASANRPTRRRGNGCSASVCKGRRSSAGLMCLRGSDRTRRWTCPTTASWRRAANSAWSSSPRWSFPASPRSRSRGAA